MRARRAAQAAALALLWAGCGGGPDVLIPGTTTRVSPVETEDDKLESSISLAIFRTPDDCVNAGIPEDQWHLCLPSIDRASGEVRVGYQVKESQTNVYELPPHKSFLRVLHNGSQVPPGNVELVPHDPSQDSGQLYILLIDGSGSMSEVDRDGRSRMDTVREALRQSDVVDAFFPEGGRNAVLLLQFTEGKPRAVGGEYRLLRDKKSYKAAVKQLNVLNGYTHLYEGVSYVSGDLLRDEGDPNHAPVAEAFQSGLSPNIVVLTDGFNNMERKDLCGDNAPRLSALLRHLQNVREGKETPLAQRPVVHTVGLGRKIDGNFKLPDLRLATIEPDQLCAGGRAGRQIDGDLERDGIDNVSLAYIASFGGGTTSVARNQAGLGKTFKDAAQVRYRWFEARYRVDPFYLRRRFSMKMELQGFVKTNARVWFTPSGWLDGPPAVRGEDNWHTRSDFRETLGLMMPMLGVLVALSYLGAAVFNVRRALTRLVPTRVKRAAAPPPAAQAPGPPPSAG